ncbi:exodeoxyribonuclease V subunit beta [Thalassotalea castellviae]|uniref:RecBCD enzyme subunit RecB n=1 Tax=Thalassotalea castellviae TaxID=3075612 RepID=A0ABU3A549_9GAMM|nr:exodeoxyribonuclease V subunit beta [Thalassotalea sp. W431]MDT0605299.1 exodeoxyribonuclease V subunit beta [Thalassotalea sp. W431]
MSTLTKVPETKNLVAHEIPLTGIHLIEASAGTGKTHNITRIYLRLLLEKKLTVKQILVMTFSKDATEELRGRIDQLIRSTLQHWQSLCLKEEFFINIAEKVSFQEATHILKEALLFLDEASIFTIHGFCKRVLTEHAFASQISFNATMEVEQQTVVLQAVQDWYRQLASEDETAFNQVIAFWPVPESLVRHFSKAINKNCELELIDSEWLIDEFSLKVKDALTDLQTHKAYLFQYLVDDKKPEVQTIRIDEYHQLITWLENVIADHQNIEQAMPVAFFDGRRFSRSKVKAQLVEIFSRLNLVKEQSKTLLDDIARLKALSIVREGIYRIRQSVKEQKQHLNVLSFDDLITSLAQRLKQSSHINNELADTLLKQYPFALVDEFQDTDPEQLSILKSLYYHRQTDNLTSGLMMIGDPKQAIYGFRGGDVFAYMSARQDCDYQWIMDTNWRSSCQMITGYNRLFYGDELSTKGQDVFGFNIPYHPVKPSPMALKQAKANEANFTISDSNANAALQLVHFEKPDQKRPTTQVFRAEMAKWCANEIIHLLTDEKQSVVAKDIALLVRDAAEAKDIKLALFNAGLPSVYLSNRTNLFHSVQTKQLLQIFKGVLFLENERYFAAALTCPLLPYGPYEFYQLQQDDLAWQEMKVTFSQLREEWLKKSFITMALKMMHDLMDFSGEDSERSITNLLHLFEIIQSASQRHKQPQELLYWFEQQSIAEFPEGESELRLESEENLIRIMTQHSSKGLEYPIVFIPFATRHNNPLTFGKQAVQLIESHDENGNLSVSLSGSAQAKKSMADEAYAESIRLLYVAITRAGKRCYVLSTPFENSHLSPLGLCCKWQKETNIPQALKTLSQEPSQSIGLTLVDTDIETLVYQAKQSSDTLGQVSQFKGRIERDWWLSSFTGLSRNIRDIGVSLPDRDNDSLTTDQPLESSPYQDLLRFTLAKGAQTGNLLHDIFEHLSFSHPDWSKSIKWPMVKYGDLPSGFSTDDLTFWLQQTLHTPLSESLTLSDVSNDHCLKEVEFYFPLKQSSTRQLAQILKNHRQTSPYGVLENTLINLPNFTQLKGMMHGFIDLIFEHQGKYYLGDYKSNYLGDNYLDYQNEALQNDIVKHHYDLQYLIYSLALHRYLRVTLTDYQPKRDFGGVYYLYLRGMTNEEQHKNCGVYYRQISAQELESLDNLFAGVQSTHEPLVNKPDLSLEKNEQLHENE